MAGCSHCPTPPPAADGRFKRLLWIALAVNAAMFLVQVVSSWLSGSLALAADALDFLGDSFNYAISLLVLPMGLGARARAAQIKGICMALFGLGVLVAAAWRALHGAAPEAQLMGVMGAVALIANLAVAGLFFSYRGGDSNMRSVWLCSRNDAVSNVAVILAAVGVALTASHWPDLLVAVLIAGLCLHSAADVLVRARQEIAVDAAPSALSGSD